MSAASSLKAALKHFPRVKLGHTPTPLEALPNLGKALGLSLHVKRDDCTGIAFGGNKIRQLEYYFGEALEQNADTVLITGAVQSNFVRSVAAVAGKLNMQCHIQLEERVDGVSEVYRNNGNVLLDNLLGATLHHFPEGEDEVAADASMMALAEKLRGQGRTPYIIHLGAGHFPTGGYGYATAAIELAEQLQTTHKDIGDFDEIIIASGSALTHGGLLFGLRALGINTPIRGICVRRSADLQAPRVLDKVTTLAKRAKLETDISENDIEVYDGLLAPGYGKLNPQTIDAIKQTANLEGLMLDPVYTGKVMASLIQLAQSQQLKGENILFWHTGGTPALFGYCDQLI